MRTGFYNTLKFQLIGGILLIALLTGVNSWYTMHLVDHQSQLSAVMQLADRMQVAAQRLTIQGMAYQENPARDYATYERDLKLYYNDLLANIQVFDDVLAGFMKGGFSAPVAGFGMPGQVQLGEDVHQAATALRKRWTQFKQKLSERMGPDASMPRLEWASEFIIGNHGRLDAAVNRLIQSLRGQFTAQSMALHDLNRGLVVAVILLTAAITLWLLYTVIRPLSRTATEMHRIAQGDFGKQLSIPRQRELRELAVQFNALSTRLDTLFRIIGQLQKGSDIEETLSALADELPALLPVDWLGILFVTADETTAKLEHAFARDRRGELRAERLIRSHFRYRGTLLENALAENRIVHISPLEDIAGRHPEYEFLHHLFQQRMRDAVFLPLNTEAGIDAGILVIATRTADSYCGDHLQLLHNLRHLISHSFGKTLKLAQQSHLASVGSFASGIAHELRNPLATIRLAIDYLDKVDLPPNAARRLALANAETHRMSRLLEDILLYSKPLRLDLKPLDLGRFTQAFLCSNDALLQDKRLKNAWHASGEAANSLIAADSDRLTQVLLNLLQNAIQAAPEESVIRWELQAREDSGVVILSVANRGAPIPAKLLDRITQPFVTTRAEGTGLGLSIVKRLIEAHGGDTRITSDERSGTRVSLVLPLVPDARDE